MATKSMQGIMQGKGIMQGIMKAKALSFAIALVMAIGCIGLAAAASQALTIRLDGRAIASDVAPYIDENSRTMVPVRFISEAFDAGVEWFDSTRTVIVTKGATVIRLIIGSRTITTNGADSTMDTAATLKDGRTFVPVRFIAEALGLGVGWDGTTNTVILTSGDATKPPTSDWVSVNGMVRIPPTWEYRMDDEGLDNAYIAGEGVGGSINIEVGYINAASSLEMTLEDSMSSKEFTFDSGSVGLMIEFPKSIAWIYADSWWNGMMLYHDGDRSLFTDNEALITGIAATLAP